MRVLFFILFYSASIMAQPGLQTSSSQGELPEPDSLIAFYPFNGNAQDSSLNNYNASVFGASLVNDRFGNINSAYSFDGINDSISTTLKIDLDEFSLSAWIKPSTLAPASDEFNIVDSWGSSSQDDWIRMSLDFLTPSFQFVVDTGNDGYKRAEASTIDYEVDDWIHIAGVRDTSNALLKLFVNGELISETDITGFTDRISMVSNLRIGARAVGAEEFYQGAIDDIVLYSTKLNHSDINELYANYHAPDTLIAEAGFEQVDLRWSSERIESLSRYYIFRDGSLIDSVLVNTVNDTTYTDTDLNSGQTYEYSITSKDTLGNVSQYSDTVSVIPLNSLTAQYKLDGNVADSSGNGIDGVNNGATLTTDRFGNGLSAFDFSGTNELAIPKTAAIKQTEDFTVSVWAKSEASWTYNADYVIGADNSTTGITHGYWINYNQDNGTYGVGNYGISFGIGDGANPYGANKRVLGEEKDGWKHIVGQFDGEKIQLYVNGELAAENTFIGAVAHSEDSLYIGRVAHRTDQNFVGKIDDFQYFSKILSGTEILEIYSNYHAPDTLIAEAGFEQVDLRWSSERISNLQSYQIYRDGVKIDSVLISSINDTSYTDTGITSGQQYEYFITSRDTLGNVSQPSDTVFATPLSELVFHYEFNGNLVDSSDNGYDGLASGNPTLIDNRFGQSNNAYDFDGIDDVVNIGSFDIPQTGTFSFWMNHDNTKLNPSDWNQGIFGKWDGTSSGSQYPLTVVLRDSDKVFGFTSRGGIEVRSNSIPENTWIHITTVWNADSSAIYINGEHQVTGLGGTIPNNGQDVTIGRWNGANAGWGWYDGSLDDMYLYQRVLSKSDILSLYANYHAPEVLRYSINGTDVNLSWSNSRFNSLDSYQIYRDGLLIQNLNITNDGDTTFVDGSAMGGFTYEYYITSTDSLGNVSQPSDTITVNLPYTELVASYPLNGNGDDESGNGNNGTIRGVVPTSDRFAIVDSAYLFDGVNDHIVVGHSPSLAVFDQDFSLSIWFKKERDNTNEVLFRKAAGGSNGFEIKVTNDSVFIDLNDGISGSRLKGNKAVDINSWQHLVVSRISETMYGFLNGEKILEETYASDLNNLDSLYIGTDRRVNKFWQGSLDDIRIYSYGLSQEEILSQYQNFYAPDTLIAEAGFEQVDLQWSSERISNLQSYQIYRDGIKIDSVIVSSESDTSFTDIGLNAGQQYEYFITSRDTLGNVSQYSDTVSVTPTGGLVAHYPFDGNANDESGNGNIGTVNGPTEVVDRFNNLNSAYHFDGIDDYITIESDSTFEFSSEDNFSISLWTKAESLPSLNPGSVIINKYSNNSGKFVYMLAVRDYQVDFLQQYQSSSTSQLLSTEQLQNDTWYHIVAVYESGIQKLFIDGEFDSQVNYSSAPGAEGDSSTPLTIGRQREEDTNLYYNGVIDDIKIYSRALSVDEISGLYANYHSPDTLYAESRYERAILRWGSNNIEAISDYYIYRDGVIVDSLNVVAVTDTVYTDIGLFTNQSYEYFIVSKDTLGNLSQPSDTISYTAPDSDWLLSTLGTVYSISAINFSSRLNGWAVGGDGTIRKTTDGGVTWQSKSAGTDITFHDIDVPDHVHGWVVGKDGRIYRTENGGDNWTFQDVGIAPSWLNGIHAFNKDTAVVVAYGDRIYRTTNGGSNWSVFDAGTNNKTEDVTFATEQIGYAVGYGGDIFKSTNNGQSWTRQTSGTNVAFFGVDFIDESNGWVVGDGGTVLKTTDGGSAWSSVDIGTTATLRSVSFIDNQTGWIAGTFGGYILKTTDGGQTWAKVITPKYEPSYDIQLWDEHTGWVVGGRGSFIRLDSEIAIPNTPTNLVATVNFNNVELNWNDNGVTNLDYFKVYRGTSPTILDSVNFVDNLADPNTTFQDNDLQIDETYYYSISAVNSDGREGLASDTVEVTIPAIQGLAAVYEFNGNINDSYGYKFNATDSGSPVFALNRFDSTNTAIQFDGDDYIILPEEYSNSLAKGAISLWVKFDNESVDYNIFAKGTDDFRLQYSNAIDEVFFALESSAGDKDYTSNTNKNWGNWNHVLATWDETSKVLYINGEKVLNTANGGVTLPSTGPLYIGRNGLPGTSDDENLQGKIDDVYFYTTLATDSLMQSLYQNYHAPDSVSAIATSDSVTIRWSSERIAGLQSYQIYRNGIEIDSIVVTGQTDTIYVDNSVLGGINYEYYITSKDTLGNISQPSDTIQVDIPTPVILVSYPFNGTTSDASGNGSPATINGTELYANDRFDNPNNAFEFIGDGTYLETDFEIEGNWSVAFWHNPQLISDNDQFFLLGDYTSGNDLHLKYQSGDLRLNFLGGTSSTNIISNLNTNQWYHIALTFDGTGINVYQDGIFKTKIFETPDFNFSGSSIQVGTNSDSPTQTSSLLFDQLTVYSIDITDTQIQELYANYHAPDTLIAEAGLDQVELIWSSERIAGLDSYQIYRDGVKIDSVTVTSLTDTSFTDTGLISGQQYEYYITSKDTLGNLSQPSDTVLVTPTDGLIVYYPFSGNANDESGNGYNPSYNNSSIVEDRFSNPFAAYYFNGNEGLVIENIPDVNADTGKTFTWVGWLQISDTLFVDSSTWLSNYSTASFDHRNWQFQTSSISKNVRFQFRNETNTEYSIWQPRGELGNGWVHVVYSFTFGDSTSIEYFENGIEKFGTWVNGNGNDRPIEMDYNYLDIGQISGPGERWIGDLDEIQIYNRFLSNEEIFESYANYHAPDTLFAEAGSDQVELNWGSERIAGLESYQIYRDGVKIDSVLVTSLTDTTFTDTGLNAGQQYEYFITSKDTLGNVSQPSDTVYVNTVSMNLAPMVENNYPLKRSLRVEFEDHYLIDLDEVFRDSNGDDLTYSLFSMGDNVIDASIDANSNWLKIANMDNGVGTDSIIISANDGELETSISISISLDNYEHDGFQFDTSYTIGGASTRILHYDIDNDSKQDVVLDNGFYYKNDYQGVLTLDSLTTTIGGDRNIQVADFDNNLNYDVLYKSGDQRVIKTTLLEEHANDSYSFDFEPRDFDVGDVNKDGILDLVVLSDSERIITYYFNKEGAITDTTTISSGAVSPTSFRIIDFNNDNLLDALVHSREQDVLYLVSNINDPASSPSVIFGNASFDRLIRVGDLNNDNLYDVVFKSGNDLVVLFNQGNGSVNSNNLGNTDIGPTHYYEDIDGDGYYDLISGSRFSNQIQIWNNIDGLTIEKGETLILPSPVSDISVFDIDYDGDQDLIVSLTNGSLNVYRNTQSVITAPVTPHNLRISQFDSDSVSLIWDSINDSALDYYKVYRGTNSSLLDSLGVRLSTQNPDTIFTDSTVSPGTTYWYAVSAVNSFGLESAFRDTIQVTIPYPDGLVAWYPFNGNANDASGNGYSGSWDGVEQVPDRFDSAASAYYFDGQFDFINLPDFYRNESEVSISFWLKPTSLSTDMAIIRNWDVEKEIRLHLNNGSFEFTLETDAPIGGSIASISEENEWVHAVGVYDGSEMNFYVNGIQSEQVYTQSGLLNDANTMYVLGRRDDIQTNYLDAVLDEVRFYNKALSQQEISNLYANFYAPDTLIADSGFEEVELTWSSERIGGLESYQIYRDGVKIDSVFVSETLDDTTYTDTDLTSGQQYEYYITSRDTLGNLSQPSDTVFATPNDGLLASYLFNGNTVDASGNGNDGNLTGTIYDLDRYGNENSALLFDRSPSMFVSPLTHNNNTAQTLSTWFRSSSTEFQCIVGNHKAFDNDNNWFAYLQNGDLILTGYPTDNFRPTNEKMADNDWHNIVVSTKSESNVQAWKVWVDGVLLTDTTSTILMTDTYPFILGDMLDSQTLGDNFKCYFDGSLDDFFIWEKELSNQEVVELYANYHAPDTLIAEAGFEQVELTWSSERIAGLESYQIYRDGVKIDSVLVSETLDDTTYTNTGLTSGQQYEYYITSRDTLGNVSQPSDTVQILPLENNLTQRIEVSLDGTKDYISIQDAINNSVDNDTILVYPGTYVENINLNARNIVLASLFEITQDTSYISTTIIDGGQNGRVVEIFSSTASIIGFSINNGRTINEKGAGIYQNSSNTVLDHLYISNNVASIGGGLGVEGNGEALISNSSFDNNAGIGCDIFGHKSRIGIENSIFNYDGCKSVSVEDLEIYVKRTLFYGSGSTYDLQIRNGADGYIENTFFLNNSGIPVQVSDAIVEINYSTIVRNSSGSVVHTDGIVNLSVKNSILHNLNGDLISRSEFLNLNITNSILTDSTFQGNRSSLFTDTINNDYSLSHYSPAIGSGDSVAAPNNDLEGNPRPNPLGSNPDIGAYESPLAEPLQVYQNTPQNLLVSDFDSDSVSLNWDSINDSDLDYYKVYRGTNSTTLDSLGIRLTTQNPDTVFTDSTVSPGFTYWYAVSAVNTYGLESALSETIQVEVPFREGLIAWYPFDGNANDSTGLGKNGVINGPIFTSDRFGQSNSAMLFDGVDDAVDIGAYALGTENGITFSSWFKRASSNTTDFIISQAANSEPNFNWFYGVVNLNKPFFGDNAGYIRGLDDIVEDEWYHLVGVAQPNANQETELAIYLNGQKVVADVVGDYDGVDGTLQQVYIGKQYSNVNWFDGTLDEVRMYRSSLSDIEILELYANYHAPEIFTAIESQDSVNLSWSSERIAGLRMYQIYRDGVQIDSVEVNALTDTTFTDTNVELGATYDYYLTSTDYLGNVSQPSDTVTVTIPANQLPVVTIESGPTNDTTLAITNPAFTWSASDADGTIQEYQIQLSGPVSFDSLLTDTSYQFTDLLEGDYTFRVRAIDDRADSSLWVQRNFIIAIEPGKPKLVSAEITDQGEVTVSWNSNPEGDLAYYTVYRGTEESSLDSIGVVLSTDDPDTLFIDQSVLPATQYWYVVSATDTTGLTGVLSDIVIVTTPSNQLPVVSIENGPANDTTLAITNPAFSWSASDADGVVQSYQILLTGPVSFDTLLTQTSYQFTNLLEGSYTFSVRAIDNRADSSSIAQRTFTIAVAPDKPLLVSTEITDQGEVTVSWNRNPEGDLAYYTIYRGTEESSFDSVGVVFITDDPDTVFIDQNVSIATQYWYAVSVTDTTGLASINSDTLSVTIPANQLPIVTIESGPANDTTIAFTNPAFTWSASDADGEVQEYQIQLSGPVSFDSLFTDTSYQFTDLLEGDYTFQVRAIDNQADTSKWAERAFIIAIEPSKPILVSAELTSQAEATISWNRNPEADLAYYTIYRGAEESSLDSIGVVLSTDDPDTIFIDQNLNTGTQYWYAIDATDTTNLSSPSSDTVSISVPKNQLALISIINGPVDSSTIGFRNPGFVWSANDLDGQVVGYQIQLNGPVIFDSLLTESVYLFDNLLEGTYLFRVRAIDNLSDSSEWAQRSFTIAIEPSKPQLITAEQTGDTEITLNWDQNPESDMAYYTIYRGIEELSLDSIGVTLFTNDPNNVFIDRNLNADTQYWYTISATDTTGLKSSFSDTLDVVLPKISIEPVKVTFTVNTSALLDTLFETSILQLRGGLTGPDTANTGLAEFISWDSSTLDANNIGGDYWSLNFEMSPGDTLIYKWWAGSDSNIGLINKFEVGWETGNPIEFILPIDAVSDTNASLNWFESREAPFEPEIDSLTIYFKVNVGAQVQTGDLNPSTGKVGMRGDPVFFENPLDWSSTAFYLENLGGAGENLFYGGYTRIHKDIAATISDPVRYKFVIEDEDGTLTWEDGDDSRFRVPESDSTVFWKYFSDTPPDSNPPVPEQIQELGYSILEQNIIELNWARNSESNIDYYKIYRGVTENNLDSIGLVLQEFSVNTTFEDHDIQLNTTYWYAVSAVNNLGLEGEPSDTISAIYEKAPERILGLSINQIDLTEIQLSWNKSIESDIDYYKAYKGNTINELDSLTAIPFESQSEPIFIDSEIVIGSEYWYSISAVNLLGLESELSDTVSYSVNPTPLVINKVSPELNTLVSTKGVNSFVEIEYDQKPINLNDYLSDRIVSVIKENETEISYAETILTSDSSLIVYPDSIYSTESFKLVLDTEELLKNSSGRYYFDGNQNSVYDAAEDNFETQLFEVAQLADFDLSGNVDFDDFVLLSSFWNTNNFQYDIAPYSIKEQSEFPFWRVIGNNVYDVQDLFVFIKYWNFSLQNSKSTEGAIAKSVPLKAIENDGSIEIIKSDINNSFSSSGGEIELNYSIVNRNEQDINGIGIELNYDPEILQFIELTDSKVFNSVDGANSTLISYVDSTSGIIIINVANFGEVGVSKDREIANIRFAVKSVVDSELTAISDLRKIKSGRVLTKSKTVILEDDLSPNEFKLFQNYPNPFNPTTTIQYSLDQSGPVTLSVYTITGQKVADLVNQKMEAGFYLVKWDASNYASGMYLYMLKAGDKVKTNKMLLIK